MQNKGRFNHNFFHHSGRFERTSSRVSYINDVVAKFNYYNLNSLNFYQFLRDLMGMGYMNVRGIYYCIPEKSLKDGLMMLWDNRSFIDFISYLKGTGIVHIYIEHVVDTPDIIEFIEGSFVIDNDIGTNGWSIKQTSTSISKGIYNNIK